MVTFRELLQQRNPELFPAGSDVALQSPETQPAMPPGAQQIVNTVNSFIPLIEQVTGLTRREIFLNLLKSGFKGGGIESLINGLMGKTQAPEAKFVKYVKTLALWVPVALFLLGMSIVAVYAFLKLTVMMLGGL